MEVTGIGGAGSLFCGEEYNGTAHKTFNINVDAVYGCVKDLPVAVVVSVKSREFFAVGKDFLEFKSDRFGRVGPKVEHIGNLEVLGFCAGSLFKGCFVYDVRDVLIFEIFVNIFKMFKTFLNSFIGLVVCFAYRSDDYFILNPSGVT